MIEFKNVTYAYPDGNEPVLKGLSLHIEEGEFILVIGPSGSGKSTLLRCINGLVPHFYGGRFSGKIYVAGRNPVALGPGGMSDLVGFVFQEPEAQFVAGVVEDELAFAMENHGLPQRIMRKRIEEVLDQLNIAHLRHRRVETLSGGERQLVAIGAVLTLQPRILVLDEPTSQLDPQAAEEVLTILQKLNVDLGITVVLAEHRLERVAQYADRIIYLPHKGKPPIIGTPREVLATSELAPPLVLLAKVMGWKPLPLTLKEAMKFVRRLSLPDSESLLQPRMGGEVVARAEKVWFAYDGQPALRGLSLEVQSGEVVALMGRNGSGKTTLLKHLVGLLKPLEGRVELWGYDTRHLDVHDIARRVGYLPQNPDDLLFAETLREELDFTLRNHGLPPGRYGEILDTLDIAGYLDAYPRDLSVGEKQRAALASILVADPEILLLDEPTRGLDYLQKEFLARFLKEQRDKGKAVMVATHDVELAARCADRVVILGDGEVVVDGPVREVMSDSLVFSSQVNKLLRDPRFLTVEDVLKVKGVVGMTTSPSSQQHPSF